MNDRFQTSILHLYQSLNLNIEVTYMYPQWFIDSLVKDEDKSKAKLGTIHIEDVLEFKCSKGHTYSQKVRFHIRFSDMKPIKGCPICNRETIQAKKREVYLKKLEYPSI